LRLRSVGGSMYHDVNGGSQRHTLTTSGHTFPAGHTVGDSAGLIQGKHSSGNIAWDHDGVQARHWAYSGATGGSHTYACHNLCRPQDLHIATAGTAPACGAR
jgi:hypothetical protein